MKRREFIKKSAMATAGAIVAPYILPSGRLFASTGGLWKAQHVVFVMFAGGVRHEESIQQGYLKLSQFGKPNFTDASLYDRAGNIMYNLLDGPPPIPGTKNIYGYRDPISNLQVDIPKILPTTIQSQGTLFKEVTSTAIGHYNADNALLQGNTILSQGLQQSPVNPTIFEYLRRHAGLSATDVWFIGNIGGSVPLLNCSTHPDYGSQYGANFFAPGTTFGNYGRQFLENGKLYDQQLQIDPMYEMKAFLDRSYRNEGIVLPDLNNTDEEKYKIKEFMKQMFQKTYSGGSCETSQLAYSPYFCAANINEDMKAVAYTCELLSSFQPRFSSVIFNDVDSCHIDFSAYMRALHRADHAVGHLWNYIQTGQADMNSGISGRTMKDNTIIIIVPEMGRDSSSNPIVNGDKFFGYDHDDSNTAKVFGLMAGPNVPVGVVNSDPGWTNQYQTADVVPTILDIFGVDIHSATNPDGSLIANYLASGAKSWLS